MNEASSLRVPFENLPIHVRVRGEPGAPTVLFAHPFPLHGACWERQLQVLSQAGLRAAAVDAPGFGGSPALGRALGMDDLAQIFALALDALHAPRAVLVGSSMGGYAVMAFARLFPERLAGAALIGTRAAPDSPEQRERREALAELALDKGAQRVTEQLLPNLVHQDNAEAMGRVRALAEGATAQGLADLLRGMAERPDSLPSLRTWAAPALVIAGDSDKLMSALDAGALAEGIPEARLHVIAGAGHLPFLERPDEVDALLLDFLRACQEAHAWSRRASERTAVWK